MVISVFRMMITLITTLHYMSTERASFRNRTRFNAPLNYYWWNSTGVESERTSERTSERVSECISDQVFPHIQLDKHSHWPLPNTHSATMHIYIGIYLNYKQLDKLHNHWLPLFHIVCATPSKRTAFIVFMLNNALYTQYVCIQYTH